MDKYEAPNIEGALPMVMQSAIDAQIWCKERGRRLCTEDEWDIACGLSGGPCNNDKQWIPWSKNWRYNKLWQGSKSGSYVLCRTPNGVYDLMGNVEEWVVSRKGRDWPYTLKGGFWAHAVSSCRKSNDFHEPTFRFYETGFRCCKSLRISVE
jgi:sulfatase modifying factor 1